MRGSKKRVHSPSPTVLSAVCYAVVRPAPPVAAPFLERRLIEVEREREREALERVWYINYKVKDLWTVRTGKGSRVRREDDEGGNQNW